VVSQPDRQESRRKRSEVSNFETEEPFTLDHYHSYIPLTIAVKEHVRTLGRTLGAADWRRRVE
jgi:hypothetical protein